MSDVTLSDGREVTFDLAQISRAEYRALFDPQQPREQESQILARVPGLAFEEIDNGLSLLVWKRLAAAFFIKYPKPLADPKGLAAESSSA